MTTPANQFLCQPTKITDFIYAKDTKKYRSFHFTTFIFDIGISLST
jgi:hypothetical protein